MLRQSVIALAVALLAACGSTPEQPAPASSPEPPPVPEPEVAEAPERPFPRDSLYALLVAEFALRRRDYDVAVENYVTEAEKLDDSGVSAHATHISQYLRRDQETLALVQRWVDQEPDNVEARNTLAGLLVRQGRSAEALPHLAAIERLGHPANFPVVLGDFSRLSGSERAELVEGVNALEQEFPDNTSLLLTQALLHAELGQADLALEKLDRLLELEPDQTQALLLDARLRNERGARRPYARVDKALRRDPDNQLLRLSYARMLTRTDMRAAREQFEILSERAPQDGDLLYTLALINREIDDLDTASVYLKRLLELGQREDEANYHLGRIEEDRGNTELALQYYQAVGMGKEYMAANTRIGELLVTDGERERMRAWFDSQRQEHPQQRQQLYGLEAELLGQAGDPEAAMALLNTALEETPEANTLLYARSILLEQRDDLVAMEADLRSILEREPDNATALNALGYTLANRTERTDEALELITRALQLQPNEPAILDSMGWVLYRQGKYEQAMDYLTRAYAEFPDPEIAAHLGEVMWVSGDREGALQIWRTAQAVDPQHRVLMETLERLGIDSLDADSAVDGD